VYGTSLALPGKHLRHRLALYCDQFGRGVPGRWRMRPNVMNCDQRALLALAIEFRLNLRETDLALRVPECIPNDFEVFEHGASLRKPLPRKRQGGLRLSLNLLRRQPVHVVLCCLSDNASRLVPKLSGMAPVQSLEFLSGDLQLGFAVLVFDVADGLGT
jgi:hypothetical protein